MEVDQIPIGLDDYDDAGDDRRALAGGAEEDLQAIRAALAQLPQEASIFAGVSSEQLRDGEDVLAVGDRGQDLVGHPGPELQDPLLVAGGAEVASLHENANRYSCQQVSHCTRANPPVRSPPARNFSTTRLMKNDRVRAGETMG